MQLLDGIYAVDLAIHLPKSNTLILSDFHIGFEESLNKKGILVPRFQFKDIIIRITKILNKTRPKTIILNGDIKHEFGTISRQEWKDTLKLIDYLAKHCEKLILIKGNHDTILGPIATKRNITVQDEHTINDILFIHGDKEPDLKQHKNIKTIVIGHEHPAIILRDEAKREKFKCFLLGKYQKRNLIVIPSFNLVTEGTDISGGNLLSPILKNSKIGKFTVFIVDDNSNSVLDFGKLKNL